MNRESGGLRRRLAQELRQRGQHRAFRIAAPDLDAPRLRQLVSTVDDDESVAGQQVWDEGAVVEAGNALWRARRKLAGGGAQARQADRYLGRLEQALARGGVIVQDHDGSPYHPGLSLEVIAMVPAPGESGDVVVETIRPSIYFDDRCLQPGQVVVGSPALQETPDPADKEQTRAGND